MMTFFICFQKFNENILIFYMYMYLTLILSPLKRRGEKSLCKNKNSENPYYKNDPDKKIVFGFLQQNKRSKKHKYNKDLFDNDQKYIFQIAKIMEVKFHFLQQEKTSADYRIF